MKLSWYVVELPLEHAFTISRGTRTTQPSVIVGLEHDGHIGWGEVTENSYYGHTLESLVRSLQESAGILENYVDTDPIEVWPEMEAALGGDFFALSAIDIAAHDLRGKRLNQPTWQVWGLEWNQVVPSSFTIGIDRIETMVEKLKQRPGWSHYKIKLGTSNDLEIVRRLRDHTDAKFRVDANCGWTVEQAITYSEQLAELGVEFIEQPLPVDVSDSDKQAVFKNSALPIIADEDCQVAKDVPRCEGLYHGINVKICKCGGLSPALQMLRQARSMGMKTMVGCMIESSIGISGAAQLLPLLDYADLDGATLLKDEPATGVTLDHGKIARPALPGCGAELLLDRIPEFKTAVTLGY